LKNFNSTKSLLKQLKKKTGGPCQPFKMAKFLKIEKKNICKWRKIDMFERSTILSEKSFFNFVKKQCLDKVPSTFSLKYNLQNCRRFDKDWIRGFWDTCRTYPGTHAHTGKCTSVRKKSTKKDLYPFYVYPGHYTRPFLVIRVKIKR
jgi:hypothetical protein